MTDNTEKAFQSVVAKVAFDGMNYPKNAVLRPVEIKLPYPPSLNGIFRQHDGSRLSAKYRLWRDEAGWMLKQQHPPKVLGAVSVAVELTAPDKRRRDLDNVGFKAIIDLLVKHQIIEADDSRFVREIKARWVDSGEPCVVYVETVQ